MSSDNDGYYGLCCDILMLIGGGDGGRVGARGLALSVDIPTFYTRGLVFVYIRLIIRLALNDDFDGLILLLNRRLIRSCFEP